ncbi:SET domain-containing protein-lysine N-methyltransferase [Bradyrhizobium lupini]|uniref:SET domain-containing protein-lysine N-methyltransferase n=1 Tax=Rhizobium lupini TaxID=136996 RepID=UPI00366A757A
MIMKGSTATFIEAKVESDRRRDIMSQTNNVCKRPDRIYVGRSKINGSGLFSRKTITRGNVIEKLEGVVYPKATKRTIQIDRNRHLCSEYIDFINHCCRPNARLQVEGGGIVLIAVEEIGCDRDEVTIDYNCSEYSLAESFSCRCCEPPRLIAGYSYLLETGQGDYLSRIERFVLPHLLSISSK